MARQHFDEYLTNDKRLTHGNYYKVICDLLKCAIANDLE